MEHKLNLEIQRERYGVCRLERGASMPRWATGNFTSITRTGNELSIVCEEKNIPGEVKCEKGWRCLKVLGPLDFALTGILASLASPLAEAGVSIFAISTFDTDYLLVKEDVLDKTKQVLSSKGHAVTEKSVRSVMAHNKQKSLQAIEDYYYRKGLRGNKLRNAVQNDREYMEILKRRWLKLTKEFPVKPPDRKRYILSTDQDYEILNKIYKLERKRLSDKDKALVKLVRTQLEHHWRTPILKFLNGLLKKYSEGTGNK